MARKTSNTLRPEVRAAVAEKLQPLLLSAVDLHVRLKVAHWNVRGDGFYAIHKMFDKIIDDAYLWSDSIAERIGALGFPANATVEDLKGSKLSPAIKGLGRTDFWTANVALYLGEFMALLNEVIPFVSDTEDDGSKGDMDCVCDFATANLLNTTIEQVEIWLWKSESNNF